MEILLHFIQMELGDLSFMLREREMETAETQIKADNWKEITRFEQAVLKETQTSILFLLYLHKGFLFWNISAESHFN